MIPKKISIVLVENSVGTNIIKISGQPSAGKVVAWVFWDAEGVILLDFLERGNTINGDYYSGLINRLWYVQTFHKQGADSWLRDLFFFMTMHQHTLLSFLLLLLVKQNSFCFLILPTARIWLQMIFICFQIWTTFWRVKNFPMIMRSWMQQEIGSGLNQMNFI